MRFILSLFAALFITTGAFAEHSELWAASSIEVESQLPAIEVTPPIEIPVYMDAEGNVQINPSSPEQVMQAIEDLANAKNLGTMGVVIALVQVLMLLLKSSVGTMAGKHQVNALVILTMVLGSLASIAQGNSVLAGVVYGLFLVPPQITMHQFFKQYMTAKGQV